MSPSRTDLAELEIAELEAELDRHRVEPFHARQLYRWIYRRGVTDVALMTDLARSLRDLLKSSFTVTTPRIVRDDVSTDGTRKFALALADERRIEAVYIPDTPSMTFCISTQV